MLNLKKKLVYNMAWLEENRAFVVKEFIENNR